MNEPSISAAVAALAEARRTARAIDPFPTEWMPVDVAEAYRLQRGAATQMGEIRGWKVAALTPAQQRALNVPCPIAAPLLLPWVHRSPARLSLKQFVHPRLECEFAFELGADLPVRTEPYTRAEIEFAITALHVVVEVVDSRLPPGASVLLAVADDFGNGAFVIGPGHRDWRAPDYARHAIALRARHNGVSRDLANGSGQAILDGDPVGAVVILANAQPPGYVGLRSGQIVTTGSCTGAVPVPGPCEAEADFGTLGAVHVRFEN